MEKNNFYNGNPQIKKAGVKQQLTREQALEYAKCRKDPIYFCRKYVKIIDLDKGLVNFDMWDFQERMIETFQDNRFVINLLPRQMGKTITVAAFLLHYAIFNKHKSVGILANKAATAREILSRIQRMIENLPFFLQPGIVEYNKGSVEFGNGSTLMAGATSSDSIRGFSFNCVEGNTLVTICDDYGRIFRTQIQDADSPKYKYKEEFCLWESSVFYTVYRITNKINGKQYIGYHQTNDLSDGYMGSGKLIKSAIEKYGVENFDKEYIDIFDNRADAEALEAFLVNEDYVLRDDTYNIALGGNVRVYPGENNPFFGQSHTESTKELISKLHTGRNFHEDDDIVIDGITFHSIYHAKKQLKISYGKLKDLMLEEGNGYVDVDRQTKLRADVEDRERLIHENRISMSRPWLSVPKTEDHKMKISKALMGKKKSDDHVDKINRNPEKSREKMSAVKRGKSPHNKGKVYCYCPTTLDTKLVKIEDIPVGWVRGYVPKELKGA